MESLLDDIERPSSRALWLERVAIAVSLIAFVGGLTWVARNFFSGGNAPARQVARISILPDAPPPPPPPEERKPEPPKEEPKPTPMEQPKPVEAPAPEQQPLKMEGPAGDGPSAFTAGEVRNEYSGGDPAPTLGDSRGRFSAYAGDFAQQVREVLARRKLALSSLQLFVWLGPDGTVQRYEAVGLGANREATREIDGAFAELRRAREAPPQGMPMPVGLQITLR